VGLDQVHLLTVLDSAGGNGELLGTGAVLGVRVAYDWGLCDDAEQKYL